jgi:Na+/H+-dicarboxylate symporter
MLAKIKDHHLLIFIITAIILGYISGSLLPQSVTSVFYTISINIKNIVMFFLPVIIFSCISKALANDKQSNLFIFLSVIALICCSNFISTMIAYVLSHLFINHQTLAVKYTILESNIKPIINISLPQLNNEIGLISGLILGVLANKYKLHPLHSLINRCYSLSLAFLNKFFIPLVPLFILGFVAKLSYEGMLEQLFSKNWYYILLIICSLVCYLSLMAALASYVSKIKLMKIFKDISIPVLSAFSTMSSTAALPLSIAAAEKNIKNKNFANMYLPASVNIHLIGDSIGVPILAMLLMQHFQGYMPSFHDYLVFSAYFIMAKFAIAAVPGGGIIVMLPILEKLFHFTPEMGAIITTFYILMDPIFTGSNVTGNNLLCLILDRFFYRKKS